MREIDVAQLEAALRDGASLIDVREPSEYAEGHVPGARHIPMGQLTNRIDELDKDAPVHVICASGNRSGVMVEVLDAAGFEAVNVRGGTSEWARSGREIERGSK
ncbi:rhodanese-like domain-containing protein [Nocardioides sp.]|uniref:rhodanese-like domain-containing protein n=1 Tax=Nocardioides sp. TaxID=35761 RepID=UPI0035627DAC